MQSEIKNDSGFGTSGVESEPIPRTPPSSARPGAGPASPAARAVLAGIGAVATAYDAAEETFDRMVDRGQRVRQQWQGAASRPDAPGGMLGHQAATTGYRMRDAFRSAMNIFLDGLNVPNKADVDTINVKLNIVTRKLDELQMRSERTSAAGRETSTPHSPAPGDLAT